MPGEDAGGEDENSIPSIELDWLEVDGMEENILDDMAMMLASQAHRCHSSCNVMLVTMMGTHGSFAGSSIAATKKCDGHHACLRACLAFNTDRKRKEKTNKEKASGPQQRQTGFEKRKAASQVDCGSAMFRGHVI